MSLMGDLINNISKEIYNIILELSGVKNIPEIIAENPPSKEMGDCAFPLFRYSKILKKSPQQIAADVLEKLSVSEIIEKGEVKGPYLNIFFDKNYIASNLIKEITLKKNKYADFDRKNERVIVEFSCPNTNKPLHLGHCRNNVLGDSIAYILDKYGFDVKRVNLINDRGIHICKSMLAYEKFGNNETPESSGKKSDHFVGDYYVKYAQESDKDKSLETEAKKMLLKWEERDDGTIKLWETMNKWAVDGIKETYKRMNIDFDIYQFESNTYLLGKSIITQGLEKNVFYREDDGSVWVDNEAEGLDKKIVLRSDGTSIYITQDLGTAVERQNDIGFGRMIYVVGSEQNYHFKTLFTILKKLGFAWADECYHLSYGMVNLPEGKMKSREGKVIDADNLMDMLFDLSIDIVKDKHSDWEAGKQKEIANKVSLAALKYYLLNFSTSKDIMFIPEQSISFDGNTGPYIQYTTARITSLLKKAGDYEYDYKLFDDYKFNDDEWYLISHLLEFEEAIKKAADNLSPYEITSYLYQLTRYYNKFYHDNPIAKAENVKTKIVRLMITESTKIVLQIGLNLLGIDHLEEM